MHGTKTNKKRIGLELSHIISTRSVRNSFFRFYRHHNRLFLVQKACRLRSCICRAHLTYIYVRQGAQKRDCDRRRLYETYCYPPTGKQMIVSPSVFGADWYPTHTTNHCCAVATIECLFRRTMQHVWLSWKFGRLDYFPTSTKDAPCANTNITDFSELGMVDHTTQVLKCPQQAAIDGYVSPDRRRHVDPNSPKNALRLRRANMAAVVSTQDVRLFARFNYSVLFPRLQERAWRTHHLIPHYPSPNIPCLFHRTTHLYSRLHHHALLRYPGDHIRCHLRHYLRYEL